MTGWPVNIDQFSKPIQKLWAMMEPCVLCPQQCRVDRTHNEYGICGISHLPRVSSITPHFGEESVLVGRGGSGTFFFAGCNLKCVFCQNYDISHHCAGEDVSVEHLAEQMIKLQAMGCSNINLVTASHLTGPIVAAIELARAKGLELPIVYNSGGYDSPGVIALLDGYVDIYMPDMKFSDPDVAEKLTGSSGYPQINQAAIVSMHQQVGDLIIEDGLARRGLLIRHLVLPDELSGSYDIIDFLAEEVSADTAINIMDQYRPCFRAVDYEQIIRRPTAEEIESPRRYARQKGLRLVD